jgi:hypothetical protein
VSQFREFEPPCWDAEVVRLGYSGSYLGGYRVGCRPSWLETPAEGSSCRNAEKPYPKLLADLWVFVDGCVIKALSGQVWVRPIYSVKPIRIEARFFH